MTESRKNLHDGSETYIPPAGIHGVTIESACHDFAAKLTQLNDIQVRAGGTALALQDPRDLIAYIEMLVSGMFWGELTDDRVNALGARAIALALAFARVQALDITSGSDSAA